MDFTTQEYFTKLILSFCNEENKAKYAALIINTSMFKSLVNYQQGGKYIQLRSNDNFTTINGHSGVQYYLDQDESWFSRRTFYREPIKLDENNQLDYIDSDLFQTYSCDLKLTFERVNQISLENSKRLDVKQTYEQSYRHICNYLQSRFTNKKAIEIATSLTLPHKYSDQNLEQFSASDNAWTGVLENQINTKDGTIFIYLDEIKKGDKGLTNDDVIFEIRDVVIGKKRLAAKKLNIPKLYSQVDGEIQHIDVISDVSYIIRNGKKLTILDGKRGEIIENHYLEREKYIQKLRL